MKTIQIQAVLYRNDPAELRQAVQAMDRAATEASEQGCRVSLLWGDASDTPVFTDGDWEALRREAIHLDAVEYVIFHENTGYGRGNNRLAAKSRTDYLMIMNPEIILPPNALTDLLSPFADDSVGLTEARQMPVEHPKAYDPETHETEWASGACFMIPRALFEKLGGFDTETFFMYCEDVDLSWRIRLAGKKLYYQPLAGVFHARRLSDSGRNQASRTEVLYTVLSEALLAYKWSRPEYARARIELAVRRGDPGAKEAQDAFRKLEKQGRLPDFLDPEHRIAHIIQYPETGGMLFTQHRYEL